MFDCSVSLGEGEYKMDEQTRMRTLDIAANRPKSTFECGHREMKSPDPML